jgi:transglutaminase-like putative cysteine protease
MLHALTTYDISFMAWGFAAEPDSPYSAYFFMLFIFCCFFTSSGVFYFTRVVYRPPFLLLILVASHLLNDRRLVQVPPPYTALSILFFFLLMVFREDSSARKTFTKSVNKNIAAIAGCLLVVSFAGVFVKQQENDFGDDGSIAFTSPLITSLLSYADSSGGADGAQNLEQILFYVNANEQIYFISQVFGRYDGEKWLSVDYGDLNSGYVNWEERTEGMNFDGFFSHISEQTDMDIEAVENSEQVRVAEVIPARNIRMAYVPAPLRTIDIDGLPVSTRVIRNNLGEIFVRSGSGAVSNYIITYYSETVRSDERLRELARGFNENSNDYLMESFFYRSQSELNEWANLYFDEYNRKTDFASYVDYPEGFESESIKALAREITQGKNSDLEKAEALESFFTESGFLYDLAYERQVPGEDIESFIFNSKRGTCGKFATAMTLMARMSGLDARYVEGFTSYEINDQGQYVIRAKNAHAFVQVFIAPFGWVTFDPTVAASEMGDGSLFYVVIAALRNNTPLILSVLSGFAVLFSGVYFTYVYIVREKLFRLKVRRSTNKNGIILLYKGVLKIARQKLNLENVPVSVLSAAVLKKYALNIGEITGLFERAFYGEPFEVFSNADKQTALNSYTRLYQAAGIRRL